MRMYKATVLLHIIFPHLQKERFLLGKGSVETSGGHTDMATSLLSSPLPFFYPFFSFCFSLPLWSQNNDFMLILLKKDQNRGHEQPLYHSIYIQYSL